ncbi:lytic transglycosylase domain-containing protein [Acuticoccus sediminis]|uniref:lytic transglycosylase domain-containing protein n=1 Tax=Acuticoccus sediminis TaxID=2184697 RepID=UPI001FD3B14C|nr:lytic transglycosylase domain-containing protein [Acuticoccus sediminis]
MAPDGAVPEATVAPTGAADGDRPAAAETTGEAPGPAAVDVGAGGEDASGTMVEDPAADGAPDGDTEGDADGDAVAGDADGAPGGDGTDAVNADTGGEDGAAGSGEDEAAEEARKAAEEAAEVAGLCRDMTEAADRHGVPHEFFIRLIWKESRFNPNAVSPVGAQGIAQFMPGTARIRGLKNPFDREEALFASAHFLADLKARFGSWGLAAAGYNGGPNRVMPFVKGLGGLPYETVDYVYSITGRTARHWALQVAERRMITSRPAPAVLAGSGQLRDETPAAAETAPVDLGLELLTAGGDLPDDEAVPILPPTPLPRPEIERGPVDCPQLVAALGRSLSVSPPAGGSSEWTPWGAQVAGHPQRNVAMRQYARVEGRLPGDLVAEGPRVVIRRFAARGRRPIHAVQFAAASRGEAEATCKRVARALVPCVVVRNR